MSYSPFLISNYATGFDKEVQPWLLPTDAFQELLDGYVYKGVLNKRDGYNGFATGLLSTYCESRMVKRVTAAAMTGAINSINTTYTITATAPVRRGTFVVTGTVPAQTVTDNGVGGFTGNGTGTINYTTGAVSITFTSPPTAGTVTATYDYHPGLQVMGVMNFYTNTNTRQLIVADTRYVNRYNSTTDRLDDISPFTAYNGGVTNFWSWTNYENAAGANRLIFCNGQALDVIQSYDGTTVTNYAYTLTGVATLNAKQVFQVKDRLVLFQTIENGTLFPRRIRISGFGSNSDVFDTSAPGAGVIDIPDNSWFNGADFNRDDIIFFMENSTWTLPYTNNDVVPFTLKKIDNSRGSKAPFAVKTYLNRTFAASTRGLLISDGYRVDRMDARLPDYAYNSVDQDRFEQCFSGFIDEDRDVYFIHPSPENATCDRILVMNFEEDNFSVYRLPLSCMGDYIQSYDITWADLSAANGFNTWDDVAAVYGNWSAFSYTKGAPISIGGGQNGQIWRLNQSEIEDNPLRIRGLTIVDGFTLRVETDFNNYAVGDYLTFEGVGGMTQINSKQAAIKAINTANRIVDVDINTANFSAWTSGGTASRVIPLQAVTKKFNPWCEKDKKVRCGWLYLYVSTSGTSLTDSDGNPENCYIDLDVITNDTEINTAPAQSYRIDCTNLANEVGIKKWTKIWINQTARFVQFRIRNVQAGAKIQVHAMMPGFQPVGRIV